MTQEHSGEVILGKRKGQKYLADQALKRTFTNIGRCPFVEKHIRSVFDLQQFLRNAKVTFLVINKALKFDFVNGLLFDQGRQAGMFRSYRVLPGRLSDITL